MKSTKRLPIQEPTGEYDCNKEVRQGPIDKKGFAQSRRNIAANKNQRFPAAGG